MTRKDILQEALKCVTGDRQESYGTPENSFGIIVDLWNAYLNGKLPPGLTLNLRPVDVAAMMSLLKVARIASGNYKSDNWIDLAGYAACGGELESIELEEN